MTIDSNAATGPAQATMRPHSDPAESRGGPAQPTDASAHADDASSKDARPSRPQIDPAVMHWMPLVVPALGLMLGLVAVLIEWAVL